MYQYAARGGPCHSHGNMHTKFVKHHTCSSEDIIAERQTHRQTDRYARHNTLLPYRVRTNKTSK